jgi:shikimate dehydrogenase
MRDVGARPLLSGHTQVVGVIGWPIEHSVSPPMHNAAFQALGLDWCYVPFAVPPERLREAVAGVRALGLRGINVTVPHKQALLALVDELTPAARAIGAVNTVLVAGDRLRGHNTDAAGFLRALREIGFAPEGCFALVLGAGGAARAVVFALAGVGAKITILNRTEERALALAREFAGCGAEAALRAGSLDLPTLRCEAPRARLVVNTTPVGMWPRVEGTPWPQDVPFPPGALLFDLVYNPRETRLMAQARAAGARAVDGLGMLVHQGAEAFRLWTGIEPPVEVMRQACLQVLGGS